MKITQFDDTYTQKVGAGETTLVSGSSGGSNSAFGGDVTGSAGSLSVVGLRQTVSLASNIGGSTIGDVLTIIQTSPKLAMFATPSNSGGGSFGSNATEVGNASAPGAGTNIIRDTHVHKGVHSLAKSGSSALFGDVTLTGGTNVTLTQSGNDISIAASGGGTAALTLIGSTTLGADAATIDYSSIPNSYKDLVIVAHLRSSTAAASQDSRMRVGNGSADSGTNYVEQTVGSGSASFNVTGNNNTSLYIGPVSANTSTSALFTAISIEIFDYASTTNFRHVIGQSFVFDGTLRFVVEIRGAWRNQASALDFVRMFPDAGNFRSGSRLYVYGRG